MRVVGAVRQLTPFRRLMCAPVKHRARCPNYSQQVVIVRRLLQVSTCPGEQGFLFVELRIVDFKAIRQSQEFARYHYPVALPEPDEDGSQQNCQKQDDRWGDHGGRAVRRGRLAKRTDLSAAYRPRGSHHLFICLSKQNRTPCT